MAESASLVALWYAGNVFFNVGMKRSHALLPDVMLLTMLQFAAGALALGCYAATSDAQPSHWWAWRRELACSSLLFFGGTVTTNISLVVLSVSFTHVLKTCEPLFTVIIVYLWDRKTPETSAVLAIGTTVLGVLIASIKQRQSASKGTALGLEVTVALLSNLLLQLRNVYNKKVIIEGEYSGGLKTVAATAELSQQQGRPTLRPSELLLVNATLAFALQVVLQALLVILQAFLVMHRPASLYEHYGSASKLWLLVPPASFVLYQIASISVLARVQPVTHAVLNAMKRVVVIGLGAIWMSEPVSVAFVSGAAVAVVGTLAYSFSKLLSVPMSQRLLQLGLVSVALILVATVGGGASNGLEPLNSPLPPNPLPPRKHVRGRHLPASVHRDALNHSSAGHRRVRPRRMKLTTPRVVEELARGRILGAAAPCDSGAMRKRTEQSVLLRAGIVDPALEAALQELQAEAETHEGMRDRNGRKDPIMGSIRSDPAALRHYGSAASQPGIHRICEVGYNWGASALVWLHSNPTVYVISFDLAERAYTNATLAWLQRRYGNRLSLVRGDSTLTIPMWAAANPDKKCDLILVDGDHSYAGELSNLKLFSRLSPQQGARYIMDDCDCTSTRKATSKVWMEGVRTGLVVEGEGHRTGEISRRSQTFADFHERHAFCSGVLLSS